MNCPEHLGVSWNGGAGVAMVDGRVVPTDPVPCFVCHPTQEREGTVEHLASIVPDPTAEYRPVQRSCVVLRDPNTEVPCGRPMSTRTVLGFPVCDDCWAEVRDA